MGLLLSILIVVVIYFLLQKLSRSQGSHAPVAKEIAVKVNQSPLVKEAFNPTQRSIPALASRPTPIPSPCPTPAPVASVTAAPVSTAEQEPLPVPTLSTTSLAKGEIPLSELWQQMLAALELPSARMLLSQQAELVRLDGQRAVVRVATTWMAMVQSRLPLLETAVATTLGSPRQLVLEEANPATMAVPAVPIAAQPLAESSTPTPSPEKQAWNAADPTLPIPNLKGSHNTRRSSSSRHPTFKTGIAELDGPGMYQRLTGCGPSGHVLYLLYSEQHCAYKVGVREPEKLGDRIKAIRESVPDVKLVGTAVFTSRQKAFDKEQEVFGKYKNHKYHGVSGRYAGIHEWIKVRPSGKPYFTAPDQVENKFQEDTHRPAQSLEIPGKYTVYLLYSRDKDAYLANWCSTANLDEKIKKARRTAHDAALLARFKIEESHKAREITKKMNEEAGTYIQNARRDVMDWCHNPPYLGAFENWDKDGIRVDTK